MDNPKCFITYSWDSEQHKDWVRTLAMKLQDNGVETFFDQWDVRPGIDLQEYMEFSVRTSDFVLIVCTPAYAEKANTGTGGVGYEKNVITGEIFTSAEKSTKFVPLLRRGLPRESLPTFLKARVFVDFRQDDSFDLRLEELLRTIFDSPKVAKPPLGPVPSFISRAEVEENITRSQEVSSPSGPTVEVRIGGRVYRIDLPVWWESIHVDYPDHLRDHDKVRSYVYQEYGTDTGTEHTWRAALKVWLTYYIRNNDLPVFVGHCLRVGGDRIAAARVFSELQKLAPFTDQQEWYSCYLAYSAGLTFLQIGQTALAEAWFREASHYQNSSDHGVKYYAGQAVSYLEQMSQTRRDEQATNKSMDTDEE